MKMIFIAFLLASILYGASQDSGMTVPGKDMVRVDLKPNGVAFLGVESRADSRFHATLEDRIYLKMAYNKGINLEDRNFFDTIKGKGLLSHKTATMDEALALSKQYGDRIYISGEIREFKVEMKRIFGFLPFGKARGEVVCFLQVLDVLNWQPRFKGNITFVGEMKVGWVGFSNARQIMPLSPMEEKYFVDEMVTGLTDQFTEIAEAAYKGLLDKKGKKSF